MFDKFKTCKDCPDRSINPPCHETCEGYLFRCQKQKEINDKRRANGLKPTAQREKVRNKFCKKQRCYKIYKK